MARSAVHVAASLWHHFIIARLDDAVGIQYYIAETFCVVAKLGAGELAGSILVHFGWAGIHRLQPHAENDNNDRPVNDIVSILVLVSHSLNNDAINFMLFLLSFPLYLFYFLVN